ncbi:MAG: MBL fold metallo-hydrolase, partial [Dehalococcoidia bacterium]|nr:MBL fold metallo-hydrolase [Dehalococcoidia bacterium]
PLWTGDSFRQAKVQEVEDGYEIMPGARIIDMIGHSPGSIGVEVETDDGVAIVTGDALHFAHVALSKQNPLVFYNDRLATQAIERVLDRADVIYPGHDQAFRVVNDKIEYVSKFEVTLTAITADRPGLSFSQEPGLGAWRVMPGVEEVDGRVSSAKIPGR